MENVVVYEKAHDAHAKSAVCPANAHVSHPWTLLEALLVLWQRGKALVVHTLGHAPALSAIPVHRLPLPGLAAPDFFRLFRFLALGLERRVVHRILQNEASCPQTLDKGKPLAKEACAVRNAFYLYDVVGLHHVSFLAVHREVAFRCSRQKMEAEKRVSGEDHGGNGVQKGADGAPVETPFAEEE